MATSSATAANRKAAEIGRVIKTIGDPVFDRDLNNFCLLFDLSVIDALPEQVLCNRYSNRWEEK
jgi:hypothetical protein